MTRAQEVLAATLAVVTIAASVFAGGVWAGDQWARAELRPDFETVTQERIWQNGRKCVLWRITDRYGTHYLAVGDCRIAERVDR